MSVVVFAVLAFVLWVWADVAWWAALFIFLLLDGMWEQAKDKRKRQSNLRARNQAIWATFQTETLPKKEW